MVPLVVASFKAIDAARGQFGELMIAGKKIVIGALIPADFASLYGWFNDVAAVRLDGNFRPVNLANHLQWCQNLGNDPTKVMFAVRKCADPAIVGYLNISSINGLHRSADIGIRIGEEKNRNQGFGKEALRLGLDYCWKHLNLERVSLTVFSKNARAIHVYRTVGFKKEGTLRRYCFVDGEWIDTVIMAAFRPSPRQTRKSTVGTSHDATGQNAMTAL
ncbi:MAG: GNAT family N-acetyltransferase [Pseudolabrys sp.]